MKKVAFVIIAILLLAPAPLYADEIVEKNLPHEEGPRPAIPAIVFEGYVESIAENPLMIGMTIYAVYHFTRVADSGKIDQTGILVISASDGEDSGIPQMMRDLQAAYELRKKIVVQLTEKPYLPDIETNARRILGVKLMKGNLI